MLLRATLTFVFLVLAILPSAAAPALWKVSDEDSSVWIFGSVYRLPDYIEWRTGTLDKTLSKADLVYFEVTYTNADPATLLPLVMRMSFNQDNTLLSDHVDPGTMQRVRDAAAKFSLDMAYLLTMQRTLAASTIASAADAAAGYHQETGVQAVLEVSIPGERLGYLETPESQADMSTTITDDEQAAMLEGALVYAEVPRADLDDLVLAWANGDPEGLGLLHAGKLGAGYSGDGIWLRRKRTWTDQIQDMLAADQQSLMVIDIENLVGDTSLIRLIEARGFTVSRLQ
ncbi:TraB/GumN family protein [Devosia sp. XK-2]|uniref:TraB/GumN family protein n=1 Tax=Devosia sp. XK-2 TaxID=3126689 RepID=UPI0030CD5B3B